MNKTGSRMRQRNRKGQATKIRIKNNIKDRRWGKSKIKT